MYCNFYCNKLLRFLGIKMLYRKGIGVMLINNEKKIFAGLRSDIKNVWQMPQGGVKHNESHDDAMWRELKEETGLLDSDVKILSYSKDTFYYDLPENLANKLWGGMYAGQCQRWFLLKFISNESHIDIFKDRSSEFCDWSWLTVDQLVKNVIYFKTELYKKIVNEFSAFL